MMVGPTLDSMRHVDIVFSFSIASQFRMECYRVLKR
jgi:hypothetical protein